VRERESERGRERERERERERSILFDVVGIHDFLCLACALMLECREMRLDV
jgi:hypothetical protein